MNELPPVPAEINGGAVVGVHAIAKSGTGAFAGIGGPLEFPSLEFGAGASGEV
jgi:hypothetical protein